MDPSYSQSTQATPPEPFVEQVRQALEYLYDFPSLQSHPLAQGIGLAQRQPGETSGQSLRRALVAAIETLNPGSSVPFRTPQARLYNIMLMHHIEGMTVQEAAHELGISRRQAHRDLRRGQESVAAVLWAQRPARAPAERQLSSMQMEIARLDGQQRATDLRTLLEGALKPLQSLARRQGIHFQLQTPGGPIAVSTDPIIARQVLVNALSHALRQAQPGAMEVALTAAGQQVAIALRYVRDEEAIPAQPMPEVVGQLAARLGWPIREEDDGKGCGCILLQIESRLPTIEIIDDNEGLVELLSEYLTGHACRVVAATSGREGLRLALAAPPDAIVLDVMMPELDGWELLQRLRTHSHTAGVPVIVCSVINNPDLAYSLGASLFLPKPVSRDEVLGALRELGVV